MPLHPCYGKSDLFDSIDPADHAEAATLCRTCPIIDTCRERLDAAFRDSVRCGRPQGTWAGQLIGGYIASPQRRAAEEALYDDDGARLAYAAYRRGDQSEWAQVGFRVWQRRHKRRLRQQQRQAAA